MVPETPPSNAQPLPLLPPPLPQAPLPAQQMHSALSKAGSEIVNSATLTHHSISTALIPADAKLKGVQMQTLPPLLSTWEVLMSHSYWILQLSWRLRTT